MYPDFWAVFSDPQKEKHQENQLKLHIPYQFAMIINTLKFDTTTTTIKGVLKTLQN